MQRLWGQPLEHPLQWRVQRVVLVSQGLAAALQQPLMEAGLAQNLLVPLAVHQKLQDVGHRQLQIQGMLESNDKNIRRLIGRFDYFKEQKIFRFDSPGGFTQLIVQRNKHIFRQYTIEPPEKEWLFPSCLSHAWMDLHS